jgi:hypothetical protein
MLIGPPQLQPTSRPRGVRSRRSSTAAEGQSLRDGCAPTRSRLFRSAGVTLTYVTGRDEGLTLGKGEVDSSILSGSTSNAQNIPGTILLDRIGPQVGDEPIVSAQCRLPGSRVSRGNVVRGTTLSAERRSRSEWSRFYRTMIRVWPGVSGCTQPRQTLPSASIGRKIAHPDRCQRLPFTCETTAVALK